MDQFGPTESRGGRLYFLSRDGRWKPIPSRPTNIVAAAIAEGLIERPTQCEACGVRYAPEPGKTRKIQLHHWSYRPEHMLDCIPLCCPCHKAVHFGHIPEPRTGRIYASPITLPRTNTAMVAALGRAGLTEAKFAEALGVTRAAVAAWTRGRGRPSAHRLPAIASALGLTVADASRLTASPSPEA